MKKMIHIWVPNYVDLRASLCTKVTAQDFDDPKGSVVFTTIECRKLTFSPAVYDVCKECFNHPSFALLDLAEAL